MKKLTRLLILILLSVAGKYAHGQQKQLEVRISVEDKDQWRKLTAVMKDSGDYMYLWTSSAIYGIGSDRNVKSVTIPLDKEDIVYEVYVRDKNSGLLGYRSINFSNAASRIIPDPIIYPNPANGLVRITVNDHKVSTLNDRQKIVNADLRKEENGEILQRIPLNANDRGEISFDVKDILPGIYFVHLLLNDDTHSDPVRKIVRLSVH